MGDLDSDEDLEDERDGNERCQDNEHDVRGPARRGQPALPERRTGR